jgi:hypothetical protein
MRNNLDNLDEPEWLGRARRGDKTLTHITVDVRDFERGHVAEALSLGHSITHFRLKVKASMQLRFAQALCRARAPSSLRRPPSGFFRAR